jgi:Trypsin
VSAPLSPADPEAYEDAVRSLARMAAGDDDTAYLQLFTALHNATHWVATTPAGPDRREIAGTLLTATSNAARTAAASQRLAPDGLSVYDDPVFVANTLLVSYAQGRIVGGALTTDWPDCVACGSEAQWCCTGTLIAPRVVVTAGHCHPTCTERVFFGRDIDGDGAVVPVARSEQHPGYRAGEGGWDDLTVLVLAEDAPVPPRRVATLEQVAGARTTRLVGFGTTDFWGMDGYGIKRQADVGFATDDPAYGARVETEFVAGKPGLDRDSCKGDSGGPAYIEVDGQWLLAGAVSRSTLRAYRTCGDGGIYTRVAAYREWIESVGGPLA